MKSGIQSTTKVIMYDNTKKQASSIKVGDVIKTMYGHVQVKDIKHDTVETFTLTIEDGYTIIVQTNSSIFTVNNEQPVWTDISSINIKDEIWTMDLDYDGPELAVSQSNVSEIKPQNKSMVLYFDIDDKSDHIVLDGGIVIQL